MKAAILISVFSLSLGVVYAAGDAAAGKAVYDAKCKSCHGATGEAPAAISKMLKVEIAPLGSPEVQKMSDAELAAVITNGKGKMPPQKSLSPKDTDNVVAFLRTLKK